MGYYTQYKLKIIHPDRILIRQQLMAENEEAEYAFNEGDESKWYDHEEDIKKFSMKYPTALFELSGEGEESGDLWIKFFKDGKLAVYPAKIVYDTFNESDLK